MESDARPVFEFAFSALLSDDECLGYVPNLRLVGHLLYAQYPVSLVFLPSAPYFDFFVPCGVGFS